MEIFSPVLGFEDTHLVSNYGRVIALSRPIYQPAHPTQKVRITKDRFLRPASNSKGYLFVILNSGDGRQARRYVHRLVADSFLVVDEERNHVNHKDLNKSNNNASNLEWVTPAENNKHYHKSRKELSINENNTMSKVI